MGGGGKNREEANNRSSLFTTSDPNTFEIQSCRNEERKKSHTYSPLELHSVRGKCADCSNPKAGLVGW